MTGAPYTREQLDYLRENYPRLEAAALHAAFNAQFNQARTVAAIKATLGREGIESGRSGCFDKGNQPWNAGTKGQGLTGANIRSFKTGNVPANRKPLWTERICSKDGFILIKVPERDPHTGFPTRYKCKHVWVWEQAHGPVPAGMVVAFINGNKLKCETDNLMLLTREELLQLNLYKYQQQPDEVKPSILALVKLNAAAGIRGIRAAGAGRKKNPGDKNISREAQHATRTV